MKKLSCIVASLIILIIIIVGITKCSFCFMDSCYFYSQAVRSKDIDIYEGVRKCFVGTCFWDGKSSEITIPDQYHGKPVTGLGGYYGTGAVSYTHLDVYKRQGFTAGANLAKAGKAGWLI